ncbi:hypothetical protein CC2G_002220 [Coprinopsis cinerea AmutBmut pab1-1]|nr:hypothetical protein CC2G_002220 [Coprinopsis cinerea AmutBmut pab1-1]
MRVCTDAYDHIHRRDIALKLITVEHRHRERHPLPTAHLVELKPPSVGLQQQPPRLGRRQQWDLLDGDYQRRFYRHLLKDCHHDTGFDCDQPLPDAHDDDRVECAF